MYYNLYNRERVCVDTRWDSPYEHLSKYDVSNGRYVKIVASDDTQISLFSLDDLIGYRDSIARAATWHKDVKPPEELTFGEKISESDIKLLEQRVKDSDAFVETARRLKELPPFTCNPGLAQSKQQREQFESKDVDAQLGETVASVFDPIFSRKKDPVKPDHYKEYMPGMQWLEAMQHLPRFRNNPEAFKGAVELQVRKYLDRNGKDEELQELSKALWYLRFLVAYIKNGDKPIKHTDITSILGE